MNFHTGGWIRNAKVCERMSAGPIWRVYEHASDHYPVSFEVDTADAEVPA